MSTAAGVLMLPPKQGQYRRHLKLLEVLHAHFACIAQGHLSISVRLVLQHSRPVTSSCWQAAASMTLQIREIIAGAVPDHDKAKIRQAQTRYEDHKKAQL